MLPRPLAIVVRLGIVMMLGAALQVAAQTADAGARLAAAQIETRVDPAGDAQTMQWSNPELSRRGVALGWGVGIGPRVDAGMAPRWSGAAETSLRLGVAVGALAPSRLIWQIGPSDSEADAARRPGGALSFQRSSSSARLGLRSTLRYDIDSRTTLTIKPRRNRISVTYAHQW